MRNMKWLLALLALSAFLAVPATSQAKTIRVSAGHSIQAAVDAANPGDKVQIRPGTYTETSKPCVVEAGKSCAVVIDKEDITIQGIGNVVLKANGDQDVGIGVGNTDDGAGCIEDPGLMMQGSRITGLTVRDFADDGVLLFCVDDFTVSHVAAINNAEYGIFPSHTTNGRVNHSYASGSNDTGFYIGQSTNSRMDHNIATDNVSGYEIENSTNVRGDHNTSMGNTGGFLVFVLPFLDRKIGTDNIVENNTVINNNRPNTCLDPNDSVCGVPPGTGILILAADGTDVNNNYVTGNDSFGIAVSNICVGQQLPPEICGILDIEPNADNTHTTNNTVTGNGTNPAPSLPPVFAVDLAWDLTGTGNCWSNNTFDTSFPSPLPGC